LKKYYLLLIGYLNHENWSKNFDISNGNKLIAYREAII